MENYSASMGFMDENWQFHYFLGVHISNTIYEIPKYSLGIPVAKVDYDASLADLLLKGTPTLRGASITETALRNAADKVVLGFTRQLAEWVNLKSNGVRADILLSGFDATLHGTHGKKGSLSAKAGELPGQVELDWEAYPNARAYATRYFLNEEGFRDVYTLPPSKGTTGYTINNLTRFKEYGFQISVIYSDHQGAFLETVLFTVP